MSRIKGIKTDFGNLNLSEIEYMKECLDKLNFILKSNLFKKYVYEMDQAKWLKGERDDSTFKFISNKERYKLLMQGAEETNKIIDYEWDLKLHSKLGEWWSRTIAHMIPFKPTIHLNKKNFFNRPKKLSASTTGHEQSHCLGSRHGGDNFRLSFGYFMNYAIENCWTHFFENNQKDIPDIATPLPVIIQYKTVCYRSWRTLFFKRCYKVEVKQ